MSKNHIDVNHSGYMCVRAYVSSILINTDIQFPDIPVRILLRNQKSTNPGVAASRRDLFTWQLKSNHRRQISGLCEKGPIVSG